MSSSSSCTRRPSSRSRRSCSAPVVDGRHRHAEHARRRVARRRRSRSPSNRRRWPGPGTRRSGSGRTRAASAPSSCGVSMPTSSAGPSGGCLEVAADDALVQAAGRSGGAAATRPAASRPGRRRRTACDAGRNRRTDGAERVPQRGGGQLGRLPRSVSGGNSRVLTRPGLRALGEHDQRWSLMRLSAALMSRTACSVPRSVPVTFERAEPGCVGDVDLRRSASPPGRPARTVSTGYPLRRSADRSADAGLAAGDPQRAEVAQREPRCADAPAGRARGWPAGRAAARRRGSVGRRRATTRSAPRCQAPASPSDVAPGRGWRRSRRRRRTRRSRPPARRGRRRRSRAAAQSTTVAPSARASSADAVASSRCRRRSAADTGGHPGQHPGQRFGLVQAGQDDVDAHVLDATGRHCGADRRLCSLTKSMTPLGRRRCVRAAARLGLMPWPPCWSSTTTTPSPGSSSRYLERAGHQAKHRRRTGRRRWMSWPPTRRT